MAVNLSTASNRAATVQNIMTQAHTTLTASGWELVYADADAIGTGTASNPAWSKAPTATTNAGRVIYRMPATAGYATRWCVQITPVWGSATTRAELALTTATDATSAGVLTNPSGEIRTSSVASGANTDSIEWYVSAYEHGLLLALHKATTGWMVCVERRRRLDGTVLDDLTTYISGVTPSNPVVGSLSNAGNGASLTRTASGTTYDPFLWAVLAASVGTAPPNTLNRMDGATGIPQGPFNVSGGTAGTPRLFLFLAPNDTPLGVDTTVYADGAERGYVPAVANSAILPGTTPTPRIAYART